MIFQRPLQARRAIRFAVSVFLLLSLWFLSLLYAPISLLSLSLSPVTPCSSLSRLSCSLSPPFFPYLFSLCLAKSPVSPLPSPSPLPVFVFFSNPFPFHAHPHPQPPPPPLQPQLKELCSVFLPRDAMLPFSDTRSKVKLMAVSFVKSIKLSVIWQIVLGFLSPLSRACVCWCASEIDIVLYIPV